MELQILPGERMHWLENKEKFGSREERQKLGKSFFYLYGYFFIWTLIILHFQYKGPNYDYESLDQLEIGLYPK